MIHFAIFASGNGTNAEAIINYFKDSNLAKPVLVISNRAGANVLNRAQQYKVMAKHIPSDDFRHHPEKILEILKQHQVAFIVLAGFMMLVPDLLTREFKYRIINIHPALLPKYGGKGMYGRNVHNAVIENKEQESGITIHYVNEYYDQGQIIFQAKCPVEDTDSPQSLEKKIQQLEHTYYPKIIEQTIKEKHIPGEPGTKQDKNPNTNTIG
ncbi:MAG: phosphoribosylglycinamide formyltransferase [Bacteroidales bacterium]